MYIFSVITLLGGLAMFLYGMRLMSGSLKESSSGTLKVVLERVTNSSIKAFLLGVFVTAIIQSSTATIVITSGLVAAGIISLRQSLGIIVGANVGTTVTGQIIRLLDIDSSSTSFLQFFKPSTLAPVALIIGIALIMFFKFKKSDTVGTVAMGFGILFTGLLNMTGAVESLQESEFMMKILANIGSNPVVGYLSGAGVAFALQSSSATVGILQAFSIAGTISFKGLYAVLCGIYLGDCVTTAIVCSIGAKEDARRVGIVNILFNLSETVLVLIVVNILHACGLLDGLWDRVLNSSGIANTNSVFNLACAVLLLPMIGVYEKLSKKIVKDEKKPENKYASLITALNPVFLKTPALAFRGCYEMLKAMFAASRTNIEKAFLLIDKYDEQLVREINEEEENIDMLTDNLSNYLLMISRNIHSDYHTRILDQYYRVVTEFEHLGDHACHIIEVADKMQREKVTFSDDAKAEIAVVKEILDKLMAYTECAFYKCDINAAYHIEPLEEVMKELINTLHDGHLIRLREGRCTLYGGTLFFDFLGNVEKIADTCSNVGVATVTRVNTSITNQAHSYVSSLHQGNDENYNKEYEEAHETYFAMLHTMDEKGE